MKFLAPLGTFLAYKRAMNVGLRLSSLGARFLLMLFMGRFFDLNVMGSYGLVFSIVFVLSALLGQDLGYVVRRDIVGRSHPDILHRIRDQILFHGFNYLILGIIFAALISSRATTIPLDYYGYVLVLTIAEGLGTALYNNMNLLNQQLLANIMQFVRTAIWVPIVIGLGLLDPAYRSDKVIYACWSIGALLSLAIPIWSWRNWGWVEALRRPFDWAWLKEGLRKSCFIWFGSIGAIGATYIDRYFVNHFLNIELVGVITFYYSFTNVLLTLIDTGILTFAAPELVVLYKNKKTTEFQKKARRTFFETAISAGVLGLFLGVLVPFIAIYMNKPALVNEVGTLWLLIIGSWINCLADVGYTVLFAQHRDRPLWIGNLLTLLPCALCNSLFIPLFGLPGIGYSLVVTTLFSLAWRSWWILKRKPPYENLS